MSVYTIDKCERFVSQRAGCGKAASPDSARGVRPQGVRLLDPICFAKAVTMKLSKKSVNALNGLTSISTNFKDMREAVVTMCQCPQRAYFHFYIVTEIKYDIEPEVCQCPQRAYFHFYRL